MEPELKDLDFKNFKLESAAQQFEDDGECGDYFPILALPSELIGHIFSFLSIKDRMKARVNKRFNTIETESKYYVENVLIEENSINDPIVQWRNDFYTKNGYHRITFYKEKSYSSDCIRKIAQNVSIGTLEVRLSDKTEFNREVCNLIKEFAVGTLDLTFMEVPLCSTNLFYVQGASEVLKEVMADSFLLDLTRACKKLCLLECKKITPVALHQVYKIIIEGSPQLDYLRIENMGPDTCDSFLNLIGITRRNDSFFSNREIQVRPWSIMKRGIINDREYKRFRLDSAAQQFEDDGESGDYFPILSLPMELISHVFSFLSMEDRLRARVNKRLDTIELETKHHVEFLIIEEKSINDEEEEDDVDRDFWAASENQLITFYKERSYSSDCIRRFTQNVSIGRLRVELADATEFNREVYNLIKEFKIGSLALEIEESEILAEMMGDSFFLDLTRACESLWISGNPTNITPEALYQVYKNTIDRSTKLQKLSIFDLHMDQCIPFLNLIGITYRDGRFYSKRDIEVYEKRIQEVEEDDECLYGYAIFDGSIEIGFCSTIFGNDEEGGFDLILHKTQDSLEEAKNNEEYIRVEISPE